jgi:phosphoribosylanthranilate isomerase
MTKVKICGITNVEDASLAAGYGADMLGFNFYKNSPRYVDPDSAAAIIDSLNGMVENIGVFVNENVGRVREIADSIGLYAVQLHGDESPEYVSHLNGMTVIKAFRLGKGFQDSYIEDFNVDAILVDAFCADEYGGTGKTCDWETARQINSKFSKMFLSGGLDHDNVADAIRRVRPFAVDACSLLESEKGKKDAVKLQKFIEAAKSV